MDGGRQDIARRIHDSEHFTELQGYHNSSGRPLRGRSKYQQTKVLALFPCCEPQSWMRRPALFFQFSLSFLIQPYSFHFSPFLILFLFLFFQPEVNTTDNARFQLPTRSLSHFFIDSLTCSSGTKLVSPYASKTAVESLSSPRSL